jgi:hypothetical protein
VGTPAYMAPEQAQGDAMPDARSDIYSLGATLFELCAGRPPHVGASSIATLARRVTAPAPRLSELLVEIHRGLDDLVARMLDLDPAKRPASAREVNEALRVILADGTLHQSRPLLREDDSRERLGTRLVTTLVALSVGSGEERQRIIERLRAQDADVLPLGTDAIVAHLGARRAHGDEASRALEIGAELADRGARVGIATGRTRVDLTQSSGEIVDRAARLARSAGDAKLSADPTTTELSRGRFEVDVPSYADSAALSTFRKIRAQKSAVSFVGREAELIATLDAYERCVDDHTPIIVSISGPPGIGKSRLGREVVNRVEQRGAEARLMVIRCESYSQAQALGVATDALRALLTLPKGASIEQARAALTALGATDEHDLLARFVSNHPLPAPASW